MKKLFRVEDLVLIIEKQIATSPNQEVRGTIGCKTLARRTSDDRPFCWTYRVPEVVCEEWGNDYDEPEEEAMASRAGRYLKENLKPSLGLKIDCQINSANSGTFRIYK